jgi:hypothetical protein
MTHLARVMIPPERRCWCKIVAINYVDNAWIQHAGGKRVTPVFAWFQREVRLIKMIAYFSRPPDSGRMEPSAEWPDEVQGLRLVRTFLALSEDKRRLVLRFVEELVRESFRDDESNESGP